MKGLLLNYFSEAELKSLLEHWCIEMDIEDIMIGLEDDEYFALGMVRIILFAGLWANGHIPDIYEGQQDLTFYDKGKAVGSLKFFIYHNCFELMDGGFKNIMNDCQFDQTKDIFQQKDMIALVEDLRRFPDFEEELNYIPSN